MPDWLLVLLVCVTVYRATRLVTIDESARWFRETVEDRFGPESSLAYLVNCPWCVSVYLGAAIVAATNLAVDHLPVPALVWATSSAVAGLIAAAEPE